MNSENRNNILFFIITGVVLMALLFLPSQMVFNDHQVCLHHRIFGVECPLCGFTRAAYSIVHLQLSESMKLNIAIVPVTLLLISELIRRVIKFPVLSRVNKFLYIVTAITFLGLYVYRIMMTLNVNA